MAPHPTPEPFAFASFELTPRGEVQETACSRSAFDKFLDDLLNVRPPSVCDSDWQSLCKDSSHFKNGTLINVVLGNGTAINGSTIEILDANPCLQYPSDAEYRGLLFAKVMFLLCVGGLVFTLCKLCVLCNCLNPVFHVLGAPFSMMAKGLYSVGIFLMAFCWMIIKALCECLCRCTRGVCECLYCIDRKERHQAEQGWRPARPPTPVPNNAAGRRRCGECNHCKPIQLAESTQRTAEAGPSIEVQQPARAHVRRSSMTSVLEQDGSIGMQTPLPAYDEIFIDHSIHEWEVNRPRRSGRNNGYGFPS